ncbi:MAG: hypothetical protein A2163_03820 [Actinobacteria bacterium RBG_13_35_12]|nr:MAG: hypothetical protein A2163_03820 [Actinobacteria bacterium RBG_13_35_12]
MLRISSGIIIKIDILKFTSRIPAIIARNYLIYFFKVRKIRENNVYDQSSLVELSRVEGI